MNEEAEEGRVDKRYLDFCEYLEDERAQEEHSRRFHARNVGEAEGSKKGRTQELKDLGIDPDTLRRY